MAQNMAVGVTLRLQDQFTGPVRALMQQFQQLTQAAQNFNRAFAGAGGGSSFGRLRADIRGLTSDVQGLVGQFNRLGRAVTGSATGGSFAGRQLADMRQLLSLQQQALTNNSRLVAGPGGSGRVPNVPGAPPSGWFGRSGFNPNASLIDRAQFRAVNFGERSLVAGALELDRARTRLATLAMPRPDPSNPNATLPGIITPDAVVQAEALAVQYSQIFRSLSRGQILDTFGEIATQFENVNDAFTLLPELLHVQDWHVVMGDTVEQARSGMLSLLRAIGLSGRLINNNGRLSLVDPNDPNSPIQASEFLDAYMRARIVGGRDVTPDQVFQVMKYLKASGQSLDLSSLLTTFIAMPDIRGSTFGNQLNMLVRGLTGGSTQAAQRALAAGGLGRITASEASGPHSFQVVDEVMLRENPFAWFARHIMGPQGYLARAGLDPNTATMAQITTALRPMFSNQSAMNIATMIVGQWREWQGQTTLALRQNLTAEARQTHAASGLWPGLQRTQSALQDVLGSVAENFKPLLPLLDRATDGLKTLARWIDPTTGSPALSMGVLAGGLVGGFWALRGMAARMGPWSRTLIGGAAGGLLGGGVGEALMGALLGRQLAGGSAAVAGAAGAAGAAAGTAWGARFLGAARWIFRMARSMTIWGLATSAIVGIVDNWEGVKTRLMGIWDELKRAAPTWAGGAGEGWGALASTSTGIAALPRDLDSYVQSWAQSVQDLLMSTETGRALFANGWLRTVEASRQAAIVQRLTSDAALMGIPAAQTQTINVGGIVTHVHVAATNADPHAIGEAAGNAIGHVLRNTMSDLPAMP
jgi:hypothetical protein